MDKQELDRIRMDIQAWNDPRQYVGAEESLIGDIKQLLKHIESLEIVVRMRIEIDELRDEIRIEEEKKDC